MVNECDCLCSSVRVQWKPIKSPKELRGNAQLYSAHPQHHQITHPNNNTPHNFRCPSCFPKPLSLVILPGRRSIGLARVRNEQIHDIAASRNHVVHDSFDIATTIRTQGTRQETVLPIVDELAITIHDGRDVLPARGGGSGVHVGAVCLRKFDGASGVHVD